VGGEKLCSKQLRPPLALQEREIKSLSTENLHEKTMKNSTWKIVVVRSIFKADVLFPSIMAFVLLKIIPYEAPQGALGAAVEIVIFIFSVLAICILQQGVTFLFLKGRRNKDP